MRPPGVAEPGPVIDDLFCLEAVGDLVQIHNLLLQGPPEPLDENIVQIPSSAVHRDFDHGFCQSLDPIRAPFIGCPVPHSLFPAFHIWRWPPSVPQRRSWHPACLRAANTPLCASPNPGLLQATESRS